MEDLSPTQPEERRSKRRTVVAFTLAALAVGGIGAAATSAAWTDNVFFTSKAEAATFNLQGSIDGGATWVESDDDKNITLVIPASKLSALLPGETRTIDLNVKNLGNVDAALTSTVTWASSPASTFTSNPGASLDGLITKLSASGTDAFQLKVTTPSDWAATNQGKSGTIVIKISGTATAP